MGINAKISEQSTCMPSILQYMKILSLYWSWRWKTYIANFKVKRQNWKIRPIWGNGLKGGRDAFIIVSFVVLILIIVVVFSCPFSPLKSNFSCPFPPFFARRMDWKDFPVSSGITSRHFDGVYDLKCSECLTAQKSSTDRSTLEKRPQDLINRRCLIFSQ